MNTTEDTKQGLLKTEVDNCEDNKRKQAIPQAIITLFTQSLSCMWFVLPIAFLIIQSTVAIHRSRNDIWIVSFIVGADIDIGLLFWSIYAHEKAPVGSMQRERHKIFIWLLATLLNVGFAYRVTKMMPFVLSLVLWALVVVTTVGTFHLYFLRPYHRA